MQVVLLLNQEYLKSLETKDNVLKYDFGKTKLHIYRGDAVAVSNLGSSMAPDQASNKEEVTYHPSTSKRSELPTFESELDFSLMSEGENVDSTLNEGDTKDKEGTTDKASS